ncbi:unknown protein [Seminavis robusta]|uniref:DUF7869 domain-containing protein n=1 Tax=Seminavis robusta TaxID=568900 RepID=A0A9N8DR04_9STRA|nr:unknown protein [Seminavis robusta]|eukprot:Sro226_g091931.1  (359) ;mRNA; r:4221-5297
MVEQEQMLIKAAEHVKSAISQRHYYQKKKEEAMATMENNPAERSLCYVADYSQNMAVPSFSFEQPGETYYYSPLAAYCFGVVDCATDHLSAYTYTEDIAKKGGNNVASLLWHHLWLQKVLSTDEPFKEITFIFDNCSGQNKNRMVLRLLFFLVKLGITKVARASFLIRGHTKNDCDRLFNVMKKGYRNSNIYLPADLVESMKHKQVTPVWCDANVFFDWDSGEDKYLTRPTKVKSYHVFTFDIDKDDGDTLTKMYSHNINQKIRQNMVKKEFRGKDKAFWKGVTQTLDRIDPVGIQDIKWRELYDKWGPLIPAEKKLGLMYYHEDPGVERRNKIKANTKKAKDARKGRTTSAATTTKE